jgi:hypothetical protein
MVEQLFDFRDGKGPVPAHRHINNTHRWCCRTDFVEIGGWVAETAFVDPTAFISPKARVYGQAIVDFNAYVPPRMHLSGTAVLRRWRHLGAVHIDRDYDYYICGNPHVWNKHWEDVYLTDIPEGADVFYF